MAKHKVKGSAKLKRELRKLERFVPDAVQKALVEEALDIFAESQVQVPVDTGRLQDSGVVGELVGRPGVVIAYGTDYALPVHERMDVNHTTGNAKFLEGPFLAAASGMVSRLVKRARRHSRDKF